MALPFYMDVHVPASVTEGLRRRGIEVRTAQEDEAAEFSDVDLLLRATELNRILFSQDADFLTIAARYPTIRPFFGLVYAHQLNTGIGQIIDDLELIATCMSAEELRNQLLFLPLR